MSAEESEISVLLQRVQDGSPQAAEELLPVVYAELRRLAAARLAGRHGHTLQPTALVHEAYMELVRKDRDWEGRRHFFGAAARAMREIMVDHARRRGALKRGGDQQRVDETMGALVANGALGDDEILSLDDALKALADTYPRPAEIVILRFFGGLTHEEIAASLDVTVRTVERDWRFARAWLEKRLASTDD